MKFVIAVLRLLPGVRSGLFDTHVGVKRVNVMVRTVAGQQGHREMVVQARPPDA